MDRPSPRRHSLRPSGLSGNPKAAVMHNPCRIFPADSSSPGSAARDPGILPCSYVNLIRWRTSPLPAPRGLCSVQYTGGNTQGRIASSASGAVGSPLPPQRPGSAGVGCRSASEPRPRGLSSRHTSKKSNCASISGVQILKNGKQGWAWTSCTIGWRRKIKATVLSSRRKQTAPSPPPFPSRRRRKTSPKR
ncbi:hypothetical protein MPH_02020 [Macrophomina phaseolina MS6]|uniref:Uncharacterized protein n=1 Tax=Macrophomina phaseolina (strain MS6) TaxID=1126212 RepID=K2SVN9_MACPH|nr:hypothetical protein MPH_02020 [Macrophomina phaseolina MS6]